MPGSSFDSFLGWTGMMGEEEKALLPFVEEYADIIVSKCSYSCVKNTNFIQSLVALCWLKWWRRVPRSRNANIKAFNW